MTSFQSDSLSRPQQELFPPIPPRRPPLPSFYDLEKQRFNIDRRTTAEDNQWTSETEASIFMAKRSTEINLDTLCPDSNALCEVDRLRHWFESCDNGHSKSTHTIDYESFLSKIEDFVYQMHTFTEVLKNVSNRIMENERNSNSKDYDSGKCKQIPNSKMSSIQTIQSNLIPVTVESQVMQRKQDNVNGAHLGAFIHKVRSESVCQTNIKNIKLKKSASAEQNRTGKKISFSSFKRDSDSSKDFLKRYVDKSSQCNLVMHYVKRHTSSDYFSDLKINRYVLENKNKIHANTRHKSIRNFGRQNNIVQSKYECCSCTKRRYCAEYNAMRRYPCYSNYFESPTPTSWSHHPFNNIHFSDGYQLFRNTKITSNNTGITQTLPNRNLNLAYGTTESLGKSSYINNTWDCYH